MKRTKRKSVDLTDGDIHFIRKMRGIEPARATGERYDISQGMVSGIQTNRYYKHVPWTKKEYAICTELKFDRNVLYRPVLFNDGMIEKKICPTCGQWWPHKTPRKATDEEEI